MGASFFLGNHRLVRRPMRTSTSIIGTSISGPITVARATLELIPNTAAATAIASSKLLLAPVRPTATEFL